MAQDSSSLSFLNIYWAEETNTSLIYPTVLDPLFTNLYVELSSQLRQLIKKVNFTYKWINEEYVRILRVGSKEVLLTLRVIDFYKIEYLSVYSDKYFLVFNRNKYKKEYKTSLNSINKRKLIKDSSHELVTHLLNYEKAQKCLYKLQIENNLNVLFVDDADQLSLQIKNILKFYETTTVYVPKIKTFTPSNETQYFECLLSKIPGLGKNAAKTIAQKYQSIFKFYKKIKKNHSEELINLLVEDKKTKEFRRLNKQQIDKILAIFLSDAYEIVF